jgi:hypothetical protein
VVHIGISYTEHYHALYSKNTNNEGMPHHHTATVNAMTDLGISGKPCIGMWKIEDGLFFVLLHVEDVLVFLQERVGTFVGITLALTLFYSFSFSAGWGDQQFWFRLVSVDVRDQVFEPVR